MIKLAEMGIQPKKLLKKLKKSFLMPKVIAMQIAPYYFVTPIFQK